MLITCLLLVLEVWDGKPTYRKSWAGNILVWIQLFNTNVNAYVLKSGFLSNPIAIQRGCRQGPPIAPYLFLIVAEILTLFIENEPKIKGSQIGKTMLKLTQYVDDTTIILYGTRSSLQATLNILEIFGSLSGF